MNNNPHSVLIIGSTGVLGSTIAAAFTEQQWTVLRGVRASDDAPGTVHVDLDDPDSVTQAMRQSELTVTSVPDHNCVAENIALKQGGILLNVSTLDSEHTRAMRQQSNATGTVILNTGLAPGVTNLVVADLLQQYPEADTIEVALGFSTKGMGGRAGVEFVYHNLTSGTHDTAVIPFPRPIGRRRCIAFAEQEPGWMGACADGRQVHIYACFDSRPLHTGIRALNKIGLLSKIPSAPFMIGHGSVPKSPTTESIVHWVSVKKQDQLLAARTVECRGDYLSCARATTIFAAAALDADLRANSGCFSSEEVFGLAELRPELSRAGIDVVDRTSG
ncbi:hypothetical protein [Antrihabitans cavernicola]|uniref:Saccharopine dehydrogenase n=1 Tax=Antrihabitans cavernicola TaxID=2495913 RepID=A0A5A7S5N6_9NOCA|nr:hypothetical protein [Spelaeibacter cavernicola]KAA0017036.1 hypothetical protein FOY51_25700 [Spelaeibacter cavernicola]